MLTLDAEQELHVKVMVNEPTRAALMAGDTGVGKTLMSAEVIKGIDAQVVLIIAPLNTLKGWQSTLHDQGILLRFVQITSSTKEEFARLRNREPGIYFIGREYFALSGTDLKPTKKKVKGKVVLDDEGKPVMTKGRKKLWSWDTVRPDITIYDEVQAVSNRYSQGFTALRQIKTGYRLAASATPQGNKFEGIWPVCRWLWPTTINPKTGLLYVDNAKTRWIAEWCEQKRNIFAFSGFEVAGEREPGAFVSSLPCFIRMEAVRTPVQVRKVYVTLTPKQRAIYDEMERDMLAWLDQHPLVADFPIVKRTRLRQITLAEPTMVLDGVNDEGEPEYRVDFADDCESAKLDALQKVIDKHHPGEPILIATDSQKFARVVAERLGPLAREWSGKVSQKQREEIKAEFGKSVRFIVAVIPALAEGTDGLQRACNVEVWLSESVNGMHNTQFEGRLNRRGQAKELIYQYKIMARGTDDDDHFENLVQQRRTNYNSLRVMTNEVQH